MAVPRVPNKCFGAALESRVYPDTHYQVRLPFKPSLQQLTRYCEHFGMEMVYDRRADPPKITFDEKALERLCRKYPDDPIFAAIGEQRGVQKLLGTNVDGIKQFIRADGRLGGEFSHLPTTLRLAQRAPSLLNLPRVDPDEDTALANEVRGLYIAAPGKVLWASDFNSLEAVIFGWLCGDGALVRLTKLGLYAFLMSHILKRPADLAWSDADLKAYFKALKAENKALYMVCKRTILSSNYATTPFKLALMNPREFPDKKTAAYYQDFYFDLFPSIRRYWWAVCTEAATFGYITTPNGFRQYFWDVFKHVWNKKDKRWVKELGDQAKECIAAKPQHLGALYTMTAATTLAQERPDIVECLRLLIHDELFFEFPEEKVEEWGAVVEEVMRRPMQCLPCPPEWGQGSHLSMGTEAKMGVRWSEMK